MTDTGPGPDFRHDREGTPASAWTRVLAEHPPADLDLPASVDRVVVVGAHPDDETLGAGGLVHHAARSGRQVLVVSATAGEGSHPASPTHDPDGLALRRRGELERAVGLLAADADVTCLGYPDGALTGLEETLVADIVAAVGLAGERTLLVAPWRHDGHPDHEAVGRAAAVAARRTDARLVEYPVWAWHWGGEGDLPWQDAVAVRLDAGARDAKRAAVAAHVTQVAPLSDRPGDEVLLGPALLAHFERDVEVFLESGAAADDALDRVHRDRDDPWDVDGWYERRKRAITLASLPRERYGRALEVGCSVGALAVDLAGRCDDLLALDSSGVAVEAARTRLAGVDRVVVRRAEVPAAWPEGRFDLVSVSEVGYFLSPRALRELVTRALGALTDDGHLLLCHWRHDLVGWPLAGPAVHEAFLASGARVLAEHQDPDFVLHVLGSAP